MSWADDDLRRAFVAGAAFWEFHQTGGTIWSSDRDIAEDEAERRYPEGRPGPCIHVPENGICIKCGKRGLDQ
jgi:hypothetical protein